MFHRTPNFTFDRQKGRVISPTEARLNKIFHRVSSIRSKGGSKQVCRSLVLLSMYVLHAITIIFQARAGIMSRPADPQTETNDHVGGDSGRTPNGIENTDPESAQIDVLHFGLFHDRVQDEVQRLQEGVAQANSAVAELSNTFTKYGNIVMAVGERYGNDQALEEKIRDLEAANSRIWDNIRRDRIQFEKQESDLQREHAEELSALRAQAEAGEREKEKYKKMERSLKDDHEKTKQRMAKDLDEKKTQLENINAEKIANLEREQKDLETANASLQQELDKMTIERDQEKETRETMQNKARTDIKRLEKELSDITAQYHVDRRPLKF